MRIRLLILLLALPLFSQSPVIVNDMPTVVTFVAPAYPRAAKDQRKMERRSHESRLAPRGLLRRSRQSVPTRSLRTMY